MSPFARKPAILLLALTICLAVPPVGLANKDVPGQKFAILVGVRQYSKLELRPLPYAENDVEKLAKVLLENGYRKENVLLMTQKAGAQEADLLPTAANVRTLLCLWLKDRKPGDTVLVALAGH